MEKSIKLIKKIIVLIITVVLLLIFNRHIALSFENFLVQNYKAIVSYGLKIIFITDILWICYDILRSVTFKMAHGLWHSTLNDLKVGIKQSEDYSEKLSAKEKYAELIIPQCLGLSLTHNEGYPQIDLIGEMKQRFEDDSVSMLDKEEIAYLILSNKSNRSIAEFCSTPQGSDFFLSCERVSQTVIRRSTFSCESLSFNSLEFRSITNEFLHIGLAYGTINTDERIDYIRKVLSWVRQEI